MRQIRTDLAMESAQGQDLPGVVVSSWEEGGARVTEVRVSPGEGADLLGKAPGAYVTLEREAMGGDPHERIALASLLGEELSRLLPPDDGRPVLVLGLGNRMVTPDALGPGAVAGTLVTRHLFAALPEQTDQRMRPVCAVAPGVLGVTGVETREMAAGLVSQLSPRAVIAVDALSARATARVGRTIQLTDTGIQPGSGVGNHRCALTKETLGVPVIAIGVPTVIYASSIVRDALDKLSDDPDGQAEILDAMTKDLFSDAAGEMIVTPREVDELIREAAKTIAGGVNRALQPGLSDREIAEMMNT